MNWQFASYMISFSDIMCCCWRVSTICDFFICLRANEREVSEWICTNSTRPKPPTPSVDSTRKSLNWTDRNSSLILNGRKPNKQKMVSIHWWHDILWWHLKGICDHVFFWMCGCGKLHTIQQYLFEFLRMVSMKKLAKFIFILFFVAQSEANVSNRDVKKCLFQFTSCAPMHIHHCICCGSRPNWILIDWRCRDQSPNRWRPPPNPK